MLEKNPDRTTAVAGPEDEGAEEEVGLGAPSRPT